MNRIIGTIIGQLNAGDTSIGKPLKAGIAGLLCLAATACGGGNAPEAEQAVSAGETGGVPANGVYDFSLEVTGDQAAAPVPDPAELSLSGGCNGKTRISLGLNNGQNNSPAWFYLAFDTEGVVAPGETGMFSLSRLNWQKGNEAGSETPAREGTIFLTLMEGTGSVTIERHDASMQSRRMAGILHGTVQDKAGTQSELNARFDIAMSCGIR